MRHLFSKRSYSKQPWTNARLFLLLITGLVSAVLWGDLVRGIDSLDWPEISATTVVAYHQRDFDPQIDKGSDGIFRYQGRLARAYMTPEGEFFVCWNFDVAEISSTPELFVRPATAQLRQIINEGDDARVYFNPARPEEAVMRRGIPYTTGVALALPVSLLLLVFLGTWGGNSPGTSAGNSSRDGISISVTVWIAAVVFFGIFALGLGPLWVRVFGAIPPWWLMPLCIVTLALAAMLWPRLPGILALGLAVTVVVIGPIIGAVGLTTLELKSFEMEWTEAEFLERLGHPHPDVTRYAALHFLQASVPDEALGPLRKLILHSPAPETRRFAASVLGRMKERAIPALPDLRRALEDPNNEPIRSELQSSIRTLDNLRRFQERKFTD